MSAHAEDGPFSPRDSVKTHPSEHPVDPPASRKGLWARWVTPMIDIMAPSKSEAFIKEKERYISENEFKLEDMRKEEKGARVALDLARNRRRAALSRLPPPSTDGNSEADDEALAKYEKSIKWTQLIKNHLQDLEKDILHFEYLMKTQATADRTRYRGLSDWAKATHKNTEHVAEALAAISFVGAGLTYTTIFSSTRGNLALMCYAFALFGIGFVVPIITQGLLKWGSRLPEETVFLRQKFWRFMLSFCIGIAVLSVAAATLILDITIFQLTGPSDAAHASDGGDDSTPQLGAHSSASISFAFLVLSFVVIVAALGLYVGGNGLETLQRGVLGKRNAKTENVKDYVCV